MPNISREPAHHRTGSRPWMRISFSPEPGVGCLPLLASPMLLAGEEMRKAKDDIAAENALWRLRVRELEEELVSLEALEGFGDESPAAEPVGPQGKKVAHRQPILPAGLEEAWLRFARQPSALPTLLEGEDTPSPRGRDRDASPPKAGPAAGLLRREAGGRWSVRAAGGRG